MTDAQMAAQARAADAGKSNDRGGDRTRGLRIKRALPMPPEETPFPHKQTYSHCEDVASRRITTGIDAQIVAQVHRAV